MKFILKSFLWSFSTTPLPHPLLRIQEGLSSVTGESMSTNTVKSLTDARAFIRIITFHEEGDGRLLEAIETCKSHMKVQNDQFLSNGRHLVFSENDW